MLGLLASLTVTCPARAQAPDIGHAPSTWEYVFPIWGDKLAERGLKFMLPWGLGVNYMYMNQPIEITKIAIGVNDSEMVDISDLIEFKEIRSRLSAVSTRVDLWLLPFMNIYALGNYAPQAETSVAISKPFPINAGADQSGGGGGFGMTFAGGFWGFFGTVDLNWTWNKLENLDKPVRTFILTPRVGKNFGEIFGVETIVWVGAMRQKIQAETQGEIRLSDTLDGEAGEFRGQLQGWYDGLPPLRQAAVRGIVGRLQQVEDPVIRYDLDKRVAHRWNMLVGGELGLTRAWRVRAEFGFIHRTQVLVGLNYRFGIPRSKHPPLEELEDR